VDDGEEGGVQLLVAGGGAPEALEPVGEALHLVAPVVAAAVAAPGQSRLGGAARPARSAGGGAARVTPSWQAGSITSSG